MNGSRRSVARSDLRMATPTEASQHMFKITRMTPVSDLPELLSVPEAAAWLHIGTGLTYEMVRRGDLPSVRLGRLVRIQRSGIVAWLERSTTDNPENRLKSAT